MNQITNEVTFPKLERNNSWLYAWVGLITLLLSFFAATVFFAYNQPSEILPNPVAINPFENISLSAKAAYVWDVASGTEMFSLESDRAMPLASLTKVMTALVASDIADENDTVVIHPDAIATDGDNGLFTWERWKLKDLINFTLITSSNDGASAIAAFGGSRVTESADSEINQDQFIGLMNSKAADLGLLNTRYSNASGLDLNDAEGGGYGSARDVAKLFEYILRTRPEIISATANDRLYFRSLDNIMHQAQNTNPVLKDIPGLLASKTGYTDLSDGNLALVFDPGLGHPIVIVVLGSTYDGRFEDVLKLQKAALEKYQQISF